MYRFWRRSRPCGRASGGVSGLLLELSHALFHFFTRLERNHPFFSHIHSFTGARITSLPRRPLFHLKNAEVAKFNAVIGYKCLNDGVERLLNDLFGLELGQTNFIGNRFHDFFFGHGSILPREDATGAATPSFERCRVSLNCNAKLDLVSSRFNAAITQIFSKMVV
jgi:hypothetical protein